MKHTYNYIQSGTKQPIESYTLLSGSPRRAELLSFLKPTIQPVNIDERSIQDHYMEAYKTDEFIHRVGKTCCEISRAKADIEMEEGTMYIAADTMVVMDGQIYNKPADLGEARKMFLSYFGKTHHVITSVCLKMQDYEDTFYTIAEVEFVPYYSELSVIINEYITKENVMDKAGAYGIQDLDPRFVRRVSGDLNTIVGLPASEVNYRLFSRVSHCDVW